MKDFKDLEQLLFPSRYYSPKYGHLYNRGSNFDVYGPYKPMQDSIRFNDEENLWIGRVLFDKYSQESIRNKKLPPHLLEEHDRLKNYTRWSPIALSLTTLAISSIILVPLALSRSSSKWLKRGINTFAFLYGFSSGFSYYKEKYHFYLLKCDDFYPPAIKAYLKTGDARYLLLLSSTDDTDIENNFLPKSLDLLKSPKNH